MQPTRRSFKNELSQQIYSGDIIDTPPVE